MKRLGLAFLFLIPLPLNAWTAIPDHAIARQSAELAPRDLRLVIEHFGHDYTRGVDRALGEEGTDAHRGRLRERIESETRLAVTMIRSNAPMNQIVERLGMLAHLVGDANNPFHVRGDPALESAHADFERYFERRLARFPTVFYGLDPRFQLDAYLDRTMARTEKLTPVMSEEYFRGGERHTSAEFDDRSSAFAVASVCYSHAVTDMVNLYYFIWKEAGGDVRSASTMRKPRIIVNAN
jgi:hypothetical protein